MVCNIAACDLVAQYVHQHKVQKRHARIAAEALTEYHNALARAETQIADATRKNHAFMELLAVMSGAEQAGPKEEYRVQPRSEERRVGKECRSRESAGLIK